MDENVQAKFEEKLKQLLAMAKKKKNVLEYQEIVDFLAELALNEEQIEKVIEQEKRYDYKALEDEAFASMYTIEAEA